MKSNKRPNGKCKPYSGKSGLQKHLINCNSGLQKDFNNCNSGWQNNFNNCNSGWQKHFMNCNCKEETNRRKRIMQKDCPFKWRRDGSSVRAPFSRALGITPVQSFAFSPLDGPSRFTGSTGWLLAHAGSPSAAAGEIKISVHLTPTAGRARQAANQRQRPNEPAPSAT
jgi:hypothetical protein